jgi:hypothetical protein
MVNKMSFLSAVIDCLAAIFSRNIVISLEFCSYFLAGMSSTLRFFKGRHARKKRKKEKDILASNNCLLFLPKVDSTWPGNSGAVLRCR